MRVLLMVVVAMALAESFAGVWFDAGIATYETWPADGSDVLVLGQGTWTGTQNAVLRDSRLMVETLAADAPLTFNPAVRKSTERDELVYSLTTWFAVGDLTPAGLTASKCGVSAAEVDGVVRYYGLAKDPAGDGVDWVALDGATPDSERDVNLKIRIKRQGGRSYVRYEIDGAVLTADGNEWVEIADTDGMSGSVAFKGTSEVAALSAETMSDAPAVMNALTVPTAEHLTVAHVRVAGVEVLPEDDGRYLVEQGSVVTVTFVPEAGWALSFPSVSVVVRQDMALPTETLPSVIDVAATVTINEVMAKNGDTLKTKSGIGGIDWVELYNRGDEPADLGGWYMGNDPTKKASKWTPIKGKCVVPAHGYKIVWFDGDELCSDWAPDEPHVKANLSTDAGKHTVYLASAAEQKAIVQQFTLPGGVKDVSYGLGHLSRTVVAANAAAECRIGEGEWKKTDGPVGMSGDACDFEVVTYACRCAIDNLDRAEAILRDPAAWSEVRTNHYQHVAFTEPGQVRNFASDFYRAFDTSAAERFIVVVTGTVKIPRAGDWTFDVCSDDGFAASLSRLGLKWSWEARGTRGYEHSTATFNLDAGAYEVKITYFQSGGGRALDFSAAEGRHDSFDPAAFRLVGTSESGIAHTGALGAQIAADVADEMSGKAQTLDWRTSFTMAEAPDERDAFHLLVRYADGFTAKLNGETVAAVAATGARSAGEALRRVSFPIDAKCVRKGANTLEITGANDAIGDTEFYLSAELVHDLANDQFVYFPTPTPGAANETEGRTGFTPKVTFDVPHGWKDAAFDLTLTCADNASAVIYYTLDGTSPRIGAPGTLLYEGPIRIEKTTVVRAAVPDADSILQIDQSATYLFYDDVIAQDATPPRGFPANKAVNSQAMYYGMSEAVTGGDADTKARLRRGLTENVRTVSFVIDPKDLFDRTSGIFVNATGNGRDWERQTMVEQINPMDSTDEFCVPAGLRIRGAFSRGAEYPKHSFRLFFRSEYGMGTLKHALFGDEGTDAFEKIDFRTSQNYGWANDIEGDTFVHELWSRDSERDMGKTYNRTRYYNLFINGVYWGLYMTEERVDDNYAESYNGGAADNYDVIRTSQPGYNTGVAEGEAGAWTELWRITTQEGYGADYAANYNRVLGLNADGSRNSAYPILLNVTNLIEFILTSHFSGDRDSPVNMSGRANNIIGFRNRIDGAGNQDGFLWNRHDAEHSLGKNGAVSSVSVIRYGTPEHGSSSYNLRGIGNFNPNLLHYELTANPNYRRIFGDLVYRHMVKKGGAMTAAEGEKRFRARMDEIDDVIVAESARWGYQYGDKGRTRAKWLANCQSCIDYINKRSPYLIDEYRKRGWYPTTATATPVDGSGVEVADGSTIPADERLYLANPGGGKVYYTMDGGDPCAADDTVAAGAVEYTDGIKVPPEGATITARVLGDNGEWSPLDEIKVKGEEAIPSQVKPGFVIEVK